MDDQEKDMGTEIEGEFEGVKPVGEEGEEGDDMGDEEEVASDEA